MPNPFFQFKQFTVHQDECAMKVGTDGVLIGAWATTDNIKSALDVGTGTGLISLMLAQRSQAQIDAIDIDEKSFVQAQHNISRSKWNGRINVFHSSFQEFSKSGEKKYDLIISNPPFFKKSFLPTDKARSAARHDHDLTEKDLISGALKCLSKNGKLSVILPFENLSGFEYSLLEKSFYINRLTRVRPKPGKKIIRVLVEASQTISQVSETEITIENETGKHSPEFIELVKDFYLAY